MYKRQTEGLAQLRKQIDECDDKHLQDAPYALNEIAVLKRDSSSTVSYTHLSRQIAMTCSNCCLVSFIFFQIVRKGNNN